MKKLAVIDGKSVFYRGYYAMPGLATADGTPTGGVFGFVSLAIELIKKLEPDYVAVAWDKKDTNIRKRRQIYPEYKANRKPAPADFYEQIPILHELLDAFGWPLYELDDYEADDILGAFAKQAAAKNIQTLLLTSDLDALQLISPTTKVYALKNGLSNLEEFDIDHFESKYGISVEQFLDFKSLKGDSSDNLPGVPGVGTKTATSLLQEYGDLDNIYANLEAIKPAVAKRLEAGKNLAYTTKEVSQLWVDAPVELDWGVADVNDTDFKRVAEILKHLEFNSLIRRLPKNMQQPDQDSNQAGLFAVADSIKPLELKPWAGDKFESNETVFIHVAPEPGELWLATSDKAYAIKLTDVDQSVWVDLASSIVVGYDLKADLHELAKNNIELNLGELHDIKQAAFLINPLMRDRSLSGLVDQAVDGAGAGQVLAALRQIYTSQLKSFADLPGPADIARRFDFPLIPILFRMEHLGIKIDPSQLAEMSQQLGEEHARLEQEMFDMAGYEFNIGSPAQLSEVLFTKLQLPTAGIKKGKTGYSTGQKELDKLRGQHPIIELIERTRELAKLKNTYIDALPKLTDDNNRIHTTFNQDVASTGRLSSTGPNLQNIPIRTELGRKIRKAFVPEQGNLFVSADYSQFELRLAAVLAGDKQLIDDFNGDIDIHTKTASDVYGVEMADVTKDQRRAAKVINFGVLYGMSPHGLSVAANMTFTEAKEFIDHYFELRRPIRQFIDATLERAKVDGYVETYFGRRRPTPDINSSNFMVREAAKRAAANMPIQGTEADLMKLAMIEVDKKIADLGEQVLQIHDSILVECPASNSEKVADILKTTMENIYPELGVRLRVDVEVGSNWGEI